MNEDGSINKNIAGTVAITKMKAKNKAVRKDNAKDGSRIFLKNNISQEKSKYLSFDENNMNSDKLVNIADINAEAQVDSSFGFIVKKYSFEDDLIQSQASVDTIQNKIFWLTYFVVTVINRLNYLYLSASNGSKLNSKDNKNLVSYF